jgi:hypothetical protein
MALSPPFRYSPADRQAITAILQARAVPGVVISRLEDVVNQYLRDRPGRLTIKSRKAAYTKAAQSLAELIASNPEVADQYAEVHQRLAQTAAAYGRLARQFHGRDFDRETLYFRMLSVWEDRGGKLGGKWYAGVAVAKFFATALKPVTGLKPPSQVSLPRIVQRYRQACARGHLATVSSFIADGEPVIANVDRFIRF